MGLLSRCCRIPAAGCRAGEWKDGLVHVQAVRSLTGRGRTDHCTTVSAAAQPCTGQAEADRQTGPGLLETVF